MCAGCVIVGRGGCGDPTAQYLVIHMTCSFVPKPKSDLFVWSFFHSVSSASAVSYGCCTCAEQDHKQPRRSSSQMLLSFEATHVQFLFCPPRTAGKRFSLNPSIWYAFGYRIKVHSCYTCRFQCSLSKCFRPNSSPYPNSPATVPQPFGLSCVAKDHLFLANPTEENLSCSWSDLFWGIPHRNKEFFHPHSRHNDTFCYPKTAQLFIGLSRF